MGEQTFNINFVRIVKNHPCVYDNTMKEYTMRPVVDKAWHNISRLIGEDVKSCKERWKNIRTVFRRDILTWKGGLKKPYYLKEEMHFMLPFLSGRGRVLRAKKNGSDVSGLDNPIELSVHNFSEDIEDHADNALPEDPFEEVETVPHDVRDEKKHCNDSVVIKKEKIDEETPEFLPPKTPSEQDRQAPSPVFERDWGHIEGYRSEDSPPKKKSRTECSCASDPDQQFLLSLKPDLEQMTMEQKRRFKRGIFVLLSDIMDNDRSSHQSPSTSSSYR